MPPAKPSGTPGRKPGTRCRVAVREQTGGIAVLSRTVCPQPPTCHSERARSEAKPNEISRCSEARAGPTQVDAPRARAGIDLRSIALSFRFAPLHAGILRFAQDDCSGFSGETCPGVRGIDGCIYWIPVEPRGAVGRQAAVTFRFGGAGMAVITRTQTPIAVLVQGPRLHACHQHRNPRAR